MYKFKNNKSILLIVFLILLLLNVFSKTNKDNNYNYNKCNDDIYSKSISGVVYNNNISDIERCISDSDKKIDIEKINAIKNGVSPKSTQLNILNMNTDAKKLMIVAHPDDEILYGSHELYKDKYLVICVTCGDRKDRVAEFKSVMSFTNDDYMLLGFPDLVNGKKSNWKKEWNSLNAYINLIINSKNWDLVVTHNPDGEYGHMHHKMLNVIVTQNADKNKLFYFGKFYWEEIPNASVLYKLNNVELSFKKNILIPIYSSQKGAINNLKNMIEYESWIKYNDWYSNDN